MSIDLISTQFELEEFRQLIDDQSDYFDLAKYIGIKYCNFNEDDLKYADIFWHPTFNKGWIYASEDLVSNYFGYTKSKQMMADFHRKLINEYDVDNDYKEVGVNDPLVKTWKSNYPNKKYGAGRKYYLITGETLKCILQSIQTKLGKVIRKYFIKTESLVVLINQILVRYITYKKDEEIKYHKLLLIKKDEENKWLHIASKKAVRFKKRIHKNSGLYVGAHSSEKRHNIVKIGKAEDFERREDQHSSSTSDLNRFKMEKTYNTYEDMAIPLESYLHSLFDPLMVKINPRRREHFMVHLKIVDVIVSHLLSIQHKYVDIINQYLDLLESNKYNFDEVEQTHLDEFIDTITIQLNDCENEEDNSEKDNSEEDNSEEDNSEEDNSEEDNSEEDNSEEDNNEEDNSEGDNSEEEDIITNIIPPNIDIPEHNQTDYRCKRCKIFKSLDKYEYTRRSTKCLTCIECKNKDRFKCIKCGTWKLGDQFTVLENCKRRTRCIVCIPETIKLIKCEGCSISKLPNLYGLNPTGNRYRRCLECRLKYTDKTKFCHGCKQDIIYDKFPEYETGKRSRRCVDCNITWCQKRLAAVNNFPNI